MFFPQFFLCSKNRRLFFCFSINVCVVRYFFSKKFCEKKFSFQKVVFFCRILFFRRFSLLRSTGWIGSSWKKCHSKLWKKQKHCTIRLCTSKEELWRKQTSLVASKPATHPLRADFFHKKVFQQVFSMFLWRNIICSECFLFLQSYFFNKFLQLISTLLRIDSWRTDDRAKCNDFIVSSASITMFSTSLSVSLYAIHTRTSPPNSIHRHVLQTFALPWRVIAFTSQRTVHICRNRHLIDRIELTLCA